MQWKTLALALLVQHGSTQGTVPMMRFECSQLVVERLDPLVSPGTVPSPHLHQIVGGNSFKAFMDSATHDLPSASTCTSCTFSEDFSNYWTAVLYFRARNGTFRRVPQFVSEGLRGNGGITVYYIPSSNNQTKVTAFKPGFRMLVGDATLSSKGPDRKVCHRCMPASGDSRHINCGSPDSQTLPTGFCVGGIRTIITFPTCWDGKNLDSPDHKSHVTYATGSRANDVGPTGTCPDSHPVVIPQVMYEVMWDTRIFNDKKLWPEDGSQPFVWSTGDSNGFSQHGDYVFGWQGDSLQRAMNARCNNDVCDVLKTQTPEEAMKCTVPETVKEDIDGSLVLNPLSLSLSTLTVKALDATATVLENLCTPGPTTASIVAARSITDAPTEPASPKHYLDDRLMLFDPTECKNAVTTQGQATYKLQWTSVAATITFMCKLLEGNCIKNSQAYCTIDVNGFQNRFITDTVIRRAI
ncbi:hypothetical protein P154DRAFT_619321 [Amniculicola lignicola CBS 123094]|uniref:DUF1996 domain-containing protein n=1 Tax=Amniculicola lignicola CBS 123094 TaxID=1392246 RepID=A0A6A5WN96_9PLEO|nr:hypothetical protein P154DRAFT_619321 [Amniculicola lignicola CBS 123094]